jgi:predicted regulator of Ras-like GTPase activity (Roadblock/LC7/MglB family)
LEQKVNTETALEQNRDVPIISVGDDSSGFANLAASLAEIRKLKGVMGYILRSNSSAIVDLTENDKVNQYAILSWQIQESGSAIAKQFNLTGVESVLVEGKKVKVLCMSMGENRMSIVMEKTAMHAWIIKRILL